MKIDMIDCQKSVEKQIKQMISDRNLGEVNADAEVIIAELTQKSLRHMQEARETSPDTAFLLLSAGNDMEMIKTAYELEHVLKNMEMAGMMKWMIRKAGTDLSVLPAAVFQEDSGSKPCDQKSNRTIRRLNGILQEISIFSEAGCKDVIHIAWYLMEQDITLNELCGKMGEKTKNVEQRIRRAALAGLSNLASRGLDDYADPIFNEYAGKLYYFEQIKREMDYIIGKSEEHGNVRIRKFLEVLFEYCKEDSGLNF